MPSKQLLENFYRNSHRHQHFQQLHQINSNCHSILTLLWFYFILFSIKCAVVSIAAETSSNQDTLTELHQSNDFNPNLGATNCGPTPVIAFGYLRSGGSSVGDRRRIICYPNYHPSNDDAFVTCEWNGRWKIGAECTDKEEPTTPNLFDRSNKFSFLSFFLHFILFCFCLPLKIE